MQNYVYIVLSSPPTVPARLIAWFTKAQFSHVSLSLSADLQKFYSFGRLYRHFVVPGGFITEGCSKGCFGYWPHTYMQAMRLCVTPQQLQAIKTKLEPFEKTPKKYKYAMGNIVTQIFGKSYKSDKRFTCASFAAYILCDVLHFDKDFSLVRPEDFLNFNLQTIYSGAAGEYTKFYTSTLTKEGI